jgi:hypothetical protein
MGACLGCIRYSNGSPRSARLRFSCLRESSQVRASQHYHMFGIIFVKTLSLKTSCMVVKKPLIRYNY